MELYQIRYFIVLAEELHFKKAAERLCIVQPALSRQIACLEEEVGFKIFERNKRNVSLTPAGECFRKEVADVFKLLENARKKALNIHLNKKEELRIGYVGSALNTGLPEFISQLQKQFPTVQTYLSEMSTAKQMEALKENQLDICFSRSPEQNHFFLNKVIKEEPFSLVVPLNHLLTKKKVKALTDVKNEPFILPSKTDGEEYYSIIMNLCTEAGFEPRVVHESVNGNTVLKLVESGLGISILPSSFKKYNAEKVKFIDLKQYTSRAKLFVVWNKLNKNPILKQAIALIKEER
jgi:DNA-binding transcriptional LysR family regulator